MSRPERMAARITPRHSSGSAPRGRDPDQQRIARGRNPRAALSESTIGMSYLPESPSHSRTLRPAWAESTTATTLSVPEADDAHRGLAVVEAEVALGEDHEAAVGCTGINPSLSASLRNPRASRARPDTRKRPRRTGGVGSIVGTAYRIRTGGLRLERAVSWASRRMRQEPNARRPTAMEDNRVAARPATTVPAH